MGWGFRLITVDDDYGISLAFTARAIGRKGDDFTHLLRILDLLCFSKCSALNGGDRWWRHKSIAQTFIPSG